MKTRSEHERLSFTPVQKWTLKTHHQSSCPTYPPHKHGQAYQTAKAASTIPHHSNPASQPAMQSPEPPQNNDTAHHPTLPNHGLDSDEPCGMTAIDMVQYGTLTVRYIADSKSIPLP
ncbi:hypothetical protein BDV97DRAFT_101497 [Delphinella strobiligena]|nr:hypothetical protein BDV97DRAFT_101497 [Delphinella strobiligena]